MTILTVIGIILVISLIVGVGLISGRKVKNTEDFLIGGGKATPLLVCGSIMGSLVSSQATIGTAQLAFHYGVAAWWFTLGAGAGCLVLAIGFVKPLRHSNCITELQIIAKEYGNPAEKLGSLLCSIGIFISVLAQVIACTGLISVLLPVSMPFAVLLSIVLICFYVIFGGAWGAEIGGVVKLVLLSIASIVGFLFVIVSCNGVAGLREGLINSLAGTNLGMIQNSADQLHNLSSSSDISLRFFSLIARGPAKDIGAGISLLLGVLSTQTYAQAIWSGKSDRASKKGALLSALLIPPIGIAGICIGLYMRANYITLAEVTALKAANLAVPNLPILTETIQAFPTFITNHMPPLFAGIVLGTLLITVVGGGAGLSLGMSTIMVNDVYKGVINKVNKKSHGQKTELLMTRITIAVILVVSAIIAVTVPNAMINDLGYLSMGLRAAVVFIPMSLALFMKEKVNQKCVLLSIIISPIVILIGNFMNLSFDPLFLGMASSIVICAIGLLIPRRSVYKTAN